MAASRQPGGEAGSSGPSEREAGLSILVLSALPAYCRGLVAALCDAGHRATSSPRPPDWDSVRSGHALVLTVATTRDWTLLADAGHSSGCTTIALLAAPSLPNYRLAFQGGAAAVVPWDAPMERVVATIEAAMDGQLLIAAEVARGLLPINVAHAAGQPLTEAEGRLLQMLSRGESVNTLAAQAGYSERQMYRSLRQIYRRLGAKNRSDAIAKAAKLGDC